MRELKFRVWLPEHATFIFPQFIYPHICDFIRGNDNYVIGQLVPYFKYEKGLKFDARFVYSNFDKNQMGEVNDYIDDIEHVIQQYTGLKDKNGKEIYEGDIVQYNVGSSYENMSFIVQWSGDSLGYILQSQSGDVLTNSWTPNGNRFNFIKLKGNLFETPELLK